MSMMKNISSPFQNHPFYFVAFELLQGLKKLNASLLELVRLSTKSSLNIALNSLRLINEYQQPKARLARLDLPP